MTIEPDPSMPVNRRDGSFEAGLANLNANCEAANRAAVRALHDRDDAREELRSSVIQVGWWLPDEFAPERMSRAEWESERLVTLWQVKDEGGFTPEWEARAIPVYIKRR